MWGVRYWVGQCPPVGAGSAFVSRDGGGGPDCERMVFHDWQILRKISHGVPDVSPKYMSGKSAWNIQG